MNNQPVKISRTPEQYLDYFCNHHKDDEIWLVKTVAAQAWELEQREQSVPTKIDLLISAGELIKNHGLRIVASTGALSKHLFEYYNIKKSEIQALHDSLRRTPDITPATTPASSVEVPVVCPVAEGSSLPVTPPGPAAGAGPAAEQPSEETAPLTSNAEYLAAFPALEDNKRSAEPSGTVDDTVPPGDQPAKRRRGQRRIRRVTGKHSTSENIPPLPVLPGNAEVSGDYSAAEDDKMSVRSFESSSETNTGELRMSRDRSPAATPSRTPSPSMRPATPLPSSEPSLADGVTEGSEYPLGEERPVPVATSVRVVRGVSQDVTAAEVQAALELQGMAVRSCVRMKSRRFKGFLPLFQVEFEGSPRDVVGITRILGEAVTLEEKRTSPNILCYRCCRFGHTAKECVSERQRCMRCSKDHRLQDCPQPRSDDVTCINCGIPGHLAAWKSCPEHPRHHQEKPKTQARSKRTPEKAAPGNNQSLPSAEREPPKPRPQPRMKRTAARVAGGNKLRPSTQADRQTAASKPKSSNLIPHPDKRVRAELEAAHELATIIEETFKEPGGIITILRNFRKLQTKEEKLSYILTLCQD